MTTSSPQFPASPRSLRGSGLEVLEEVMSPSEEADRLIELWLDDEQNLVLSTLEEMEAPWGRAVLAQFMLRLMDQDPTSLHTFVEMLEDQC